MTTKVPQGWHSVTPRLVVADTALLVEFLKQAFGATGEHRTDRRNFGQVVNLQKRPSTIESTVTR